MKMIPLLLVGFATLSPVRSQEVVHRAKILSLAGELQQTPEFQFSGPKKKATKPRSWLEIEAEVEVETKAPSGFIPELTAQWFAVVLDQAGGKPVRLSGSVTFKNVRTAGGSVFLSAYIEPDTMERLTGKAKPGSRDLEGFALVLSGPGILDQGKFAEGLVKATAEEKSKWWAEWKHETLEDAIVAKSKTPFAPLWTDRYPAEKPQK